jgi:hypothetical protein
VEIKISECYTNPIGSALLNFIDLLVNCQIVTAYPAIRRPKLYFQPLSFTFETFGKKLAETKIVARVNVKKIKAKK